MIITIRTDKPEAEVGLYINHLQISQKNWLAHRELSDTLHRTILSELEAQNKGWSDITGIVFYKGPGSFTGLRIGASIANALAVTLNIPISSESGENWISTGIDSIEGGKRGIALPDYGSDPHITKPKK